MSAEPEPETPELEQETETEEKKPMFEPTLEYEREIEEPQSVLEPALGYEREIDESKLVVEREFEYEKREIDVEEPEKTSSYTSSSPLPVTEQQELYPTSASPTPGQCHYGPNWLSYSCS